MNRRMYEYVGVSDFRLYRPDNLCSGAAEIIDHRSEGS